MRNLHHKQYKVIAKCELATITSIDSNQAHSASLLNRTSKRGSNCEEDARKA